MPYDKPGKLSLPLKLTIAAIVIGVPVLIIKLIMWL